MKAEGGLAIDHRKTRFTNRAVYLLAGIALLGGLLYLLVLVRPFNLLDLYQFPHLDLHKLSENRPMARWSLLALFLVQGLNAHDIFPDWIALNNGTSHGIEASDQGIQVDLTA